MGTLIKNPQDRTVARRSALRMAFVLAALAGNVLLPVNPALAQTQAQSASERVVAERLVKAAYLYKFGSYVQWPEGTFSSADAPLKIGVVGDDELAEELARLVVGRHCNGRPITVHKVRGDAAQPKVHILFLGGAKSQTAKVLQNLKGQPMLLVTQLENGLDLGSMINFVAVDGKVRFEVAPGTVEFSELAISSRLFPIASKVASLPK